ncbi:MAG: hypothetical protein K0S79_1177, partial [Nitrospira sp.]|nr:hypothetical protein [Nitrospira sp.]
MHESVVLRTTLIVLVVSMLTLAASPTLMAEEASETPFKDKLMIRG